MHPPPHKTFGSRMMEENIASAEPIITKWDVSSSSHAKITSLFYESRDDSRAFLRAVSDLNLAMHFFISDHPTAHNHLLTRAQLLTQTAMARLQKEFHQILAANRDRHDGGSITSSARSSFSASSSSDLEEGDGSEDEEDGVARISGRDNSSSTAAAAHGEVTTAMSDLRAIAECMVSCGYSNECVKVYKMVRRSIVDEGIYHLGFLQVQRLDHHAAERRIKAWLAASRPAVRTLFSRERLLCDYVFGFSSSIAEPIFTEVAKAAAAAFLHFPELAARTKKLPERLFLFLDLYDSVAELLPEIDSVFSYSSTAAVRAQATASLSSLGEAVRSTVAEFESAIQKDASRNAVPGGGIHPLTRYVMNYLAFLADYGVALAEIFADHPLPPHMTLPESFITIASTPNSTAPSSPSRAEGDDAESTLAASDAFAAASSVVSARVAWLILVLLCKLDGKAELYRDAPLSYISLANNLKYVVDKVRACELRRLLGDEWVARHDDKAMAYAMSYVRLGWKKVISSIPSGLQMEAEEAAERMREFNAAFEEAYRRQAGWVVANGRMRDEIKVAIARMVIRPYKEFYDRCREEVGDVAMRFAPEDLGNYLSDLFYGGVIGSPSVSVGSSGDTAAKASRWQSV